MASPKPQSLKRSHESFNFDELTDLEQPFYVSPEMAVTYATQPQEPVEADNAEASFPTPPISIGNKTGPSPARSRSASLTDPGSATPSLRGDSPIPSLQPRASPSPSAFAALNGKGSAPPPAKKPKLTFAEKEMKRIQKEIKDQDKAEERARREQGRQVAAQDKARRDAEKEAERKKKEAEKELKQAEKELKQADKELKQADKELKQADKELKQAGKDQKAAEKAVRDEKKRKKDEEKQRAEEVKRKEQGKQKSLSSFFAIPPATAARRKSVDKRSESPAPSRNLPVSAASQSASTPSRPELSVYEKTFPEFYIYQNVTMAPVNRFGRDKQATESVYNNVDSYLLGNRSPAHRRKSDAESLFNLSVHDNVLRGRQVLPVRQIMSEVTGKSTKPIDLTGDSQNTQTMRLGDYLAKVPVKFLKFQEDVRPPYRGTYTSQPIHGVSRFARNPLRRDLPDTNYDYDSEAEWIEEEEDAEELNSEDEDEEMGEDQEDMEGFLDDEHDETAHSKRLVLQGDLEPISTGLLFEDKKKRTPNVKMMPYRMEFILDQKMKSIDPFSTVYWDTAAKSTMDPPRVPLNTLKSSSLTVNGSSKPVKPFFTSASNIAKAASAQDDAITVAPVMTPMMANAKPKKPFPTEDLPSFKLAIQGSDLSKVGLIEVLKKKFPGKSGAMIKSTLETVAKRVGIKEADKRWQLVAEEST